MTKSFQVKYINHKGKRRIVTIGRAKSKEQAIRFIRKYIGKPTKIRELKSHNTHTTRG